MALKTVRGFLRLGRNEQQIVLLAVVALVVTRAGLRVLRLRTLQRFLGTAEQRAATQLSSRESIDASRAIAKLQGSAERHLFFTPSCLERSLVLQWMLRRHGIHSTMRLGARKQDQRFEAHAWVEVNGLSLDSSPNDGAAFAPFDAMHSAFKTEIP